MSERQMNVNLNFIRGDHLERYEIARDTCSGSVIDAACGTGYGSFIMSDSPNINSIDSIDISEEAINLGRKTWKTSKMTFINQSVLDFKFEKIYDWFVSFETIEHVPNIELFLTEASKHCKNIICSVPNEDVLPFEADKFPFHLRHYTPEQFKQLIESCGFDIDCVKYQKDKQRNSLNNKTGRTIIIQGKSRNIKG